MKEAPFCIKANDDKPKEITFRDPCMPVGLVREWEVSRGYSGTALIRHIPDLSQCSLLRASLASYCGDWTVACLGETFAAPLSTNAKLVRSDSPRLPSRWVLVCR